VGRRRRKVVERAGEGRLSEAPILVGSCNYTIIYSENFCNS
jgi:hypothetical protein